MTAISANSGLPSGGAVSCASECTLSVVSHGQGALLRRLLSQLNAQPSLSGIRVIVTLNVPEEFDVKGFPSLDISVETNERPRGFGANHNSAFRQCRTEWFAVLNPDLVLDGQEPFTRLIEAAKCLTRAGVVAPRIVNERLEVEDSVRGNLTPLSLFRRQVLGRRRPWEEDGFHWLAGMFLLVNARAFGSVGGFDERFFLYCEDYDLCARLYNEGYAVELVADARVIHEARRDSHRSWRHLRWHLESLIRVWLSGAFWKVMFRKRVKI